MPALAYKRILLKLSGEVLGARGRGIDPAKLQAVANIIRAAKKLGVEIGIVMGGGNWWRKRDSGKAIRPETSDYMGMIGTVLNGLALSSYLNQAGVKTIIQAYLVSAPTVAKVNIPAANKALKSGQVVIFAGGTGKPFVTTDTAAAKLAQAIKADVIFKVGEVDGVYTTDPNKNPRAKKFKDISFKEAQQRKLRIFDLNAYQICEQADIPLWVFKWSRGNLTRALQGQRVGTIIY